MSKDKEIEIIVDTELIAQFFYGQLLKLGYTPTENEVDDIAEITFDYLVELGIVEEEELDEGDDWDGI